MTLFIQLLSLIAGLGVFLYGMRVISEHLERSAGGGIKKLFDKMSGNRFVGVAVGTGITAIIQSSSATTVMVLGFVNAGLMTLFQATSVIMGANIGTTITAILVSLKALPISAIFSAGTVVGVFLIMFSKKDKLKLIGGIITGLGLIFIGLDAMTNSMTFLRSEPFFINTISSLTNPFLLVFVGLLFTAIIQSSSATTGIVVALVFTQSMDLSYALYIILGTNIGTCITAFMASIGASTNAKRTALIHLMFNVIGVLIFFPILLIFEKPLVNLMMSIGVPTFSIAIFHIVFNLLTTLVLLPFIELLVKIVTKLIKDKPSDVANVLHLEYLDDRLVQTPSLAVNQVLKEISGMSRLAKTNLKLSMTHMLDNDLSTKEQIMKNEEKIDFLTRGVADYLVKLSTVHLTERDEELIGAMYHVISDIERIGDHATNFLDYTEQLSVHNLAFTLEGIEDIRIMNDTVLSMFDMTEAIFEGGKFEKFKELLDLEDRVDFLKDSLAEGHIKRLSEGKCNIDSGAIFFGVLTDLERVADHLVNIASSIEPRKIKERRKIRHSLNQSTKQ